MNEKEALDLLYHIHCSNCMPSITISEQELWDKIKKDLEVLNVLKKYLSIKSFSPYEHPELIILSGGEIKDIEEAKIIKEWLEK